MKFQELFLVPLIFLLGFLLVAPTPSWALDLVIACNIGFSILLLVSCLFTIKLTRLLVFPTLILLLTLFRIATNVATTRMILTQADAGEIINAFGRLLIGGDIVVGLVIFSLISLVSIVVITRGALRISEVAARFTLDALPARQASIEQEFRSGVISFEEAQVRREELRKESMLYGSMEGAMKFIQGDAIISVLAVVINMVGGVFVGMKGKLTFDQAVQKYSVLSVGDGLVAQIPALFLAISAGVIVSRVSSMAQGSFVAQVAEQFFYRKDALIAAGGITAFLALLPGLPNLPFFVLGAIFICLASISSGKNKSVGGEFKRGRNTARLILPASLCGSLPENTFQIVSHIREDISARIGFPLPDFEIDISNSTTVALVDIKGRRFEIPFPISHKLVINCPPFYAKFFKDQDVRGLKLPFLDLKALALSKNLKNIRLAQAINAEILDPVEFIALRACEVLVANPDTFVDVGSTLAVMRDLVRAVPELEGILYSERFIAPTKFSELLKTLVRARLSVCDIVLLIEKIHNICLRYNQTRNDDTLNVEDLFQLLLSDGINSAVLPFELVFSQDCFMCLITERSTENEPRSGIITKSVAEFGAAPCLKLYPQFQSVKDTGSQAVEFYLDGLKAKPFCTIVEL